VIKHMAPMTKVNGVMCPYADKDCPKLENVASNVDENAKRLTNIERLVYIAIGMIAVNSGLILWP